MKTQAKLNSDLATDIVNNLARPNIDLDKTITTSFLGTMKNIAKTHVDLDRKVFYDFE